MELLENLRWRYATKKFNPTQKVSEEHIEQIKEAIQLTASSYGLQLYKVLIIENKDLREKLQPASWGQSQVVDASHLFVFCNYTEALEEHLDAFMKLKSETNAIELSNLEGYKSFIMDKIGEKSNEEYRNWTARQTYIALSNLLNACAALRIDSCPMEGFEPDKYNEILGLNEKGLEAAVVAAVGYRSMEDHTQHANKARKAKEDLFEVI